MQFTEKISPPRTIIDTSVLSCDKIAFYHIQFNFLLTVAYWFCAAVVIRTETGVLLPPSRPKVHGMLAPVNGEKLPEITIPRAGRFVTSTITARGGLRKDSFRANDPGPLPHHAQRALHLFHSKKVRVGVA